MNVSDDVRVVSSFESLMATKLKSTGFSLPPIAKSRSRQAGNHLSRYRGRGLNFEEFRHYQMGDDIRSIDWNVTQRMLEPHVRVQSEEKDLPVVLLVDQRSSMFFSSVDTMKSVAAAQVAACCAWKVLKDSDRIGALIFSNDQLYWHKPQRHSAHVAASRQRRSKSGSHRKQSYLHPTTRAFSLEQLSSKCAWTCRC